MSDDPTNVISRLKKLAADHNHNFTSNIQDMLVAAFEMGANWAEQEEGYECDECCARIPDASGLHNKHHESFCSLYSKNSSV